MVAPKLQKNMKKRYIAWTVFLDLVTKYLSIKVDRNHMVDKID